jgi:hypothetical protein
MFAAPLCVSIRTLAAFRFETQRHSGIDLANTGSFVLQHSCLRLTCLRPTRQHDPGGAEITASTRSQKITAQEDRDSGHNRDQDPNYYG